MHTIGKHRFVIETNIPTGKFKNKTVMTDHGPTTVPDGEPEYEYHWFAGIGANPDMLKKGAVIPMNVWTPYPSQAVMYEDRDNAQFVVDIVMGGQSGGYVVEEKDSHLHEGRKVVALIPNAEIQIKP
jgi:hypothetical protein